MKRFLVMLFVLLFSTIVLVACGSSENNKNEADSEIIEFTDSAGRSVELPAKIESFAPSAGLAQQALYTIAPEQFVGFASSPSDAQKKYMDEKYWSLPTFGQFHDDTFNLEALVAAAPDVIIDIGEPKGDIVESMDEIQRKTGIPTVFIEASLETIPDMYDTLGKLLGKEEQAKKLANFSQKTLDAAEVLREKVTDDNRISLYYGSREKGLNTNAAGSFHLEVLDYLDIENVAVFDERVSGGGGNEVSMEQILLWDPEIILLDDNNIYERIVSGQEATWQDLTAVQKGEVYLIPQEPYNWVGFPPSVNRVMGMNWLADLVYPDLYQGDIKEAVKEYYSIFYHYDLSDDEADQLLKSAARKE